MKLEERLEQLRRLREGEPTERTDDVLRKALADRSNLIVAEAAKGVAHQRRVALMPDLLSAFDRLFETPVKVDPKCWGKTAIIKALTSLDYSDSPAFLRAAKHVQMEPVWGGQEDAAIHLRAHGVLALVACTDIGRPQILRHLVDALADPADTVRIEAVRAVEQMNGEEGCLILRLKAHSGDSRPPVLGQTFDSLLALEGSQAVSFIVPFLESAVDETCDEAAFSLGASRQPEAVKILIETWKRNRRRAFGSVLLRSLSSSRDETALEFLLELVREGTSTESASSLEALHLHRDSPEIMERVEQAKRAKA